MSAVLIAAGLSADRVFIEFISTIFLEIGNCRPIPLGAAFDIWC
jgi:hypothetical protein